MNNCYTFNVSTNTLVPKQNMNKTRVHHGLQKMTQKILTFGGYNGNQNMKSAEIYDVVQNSWKNLPDMPEVGTGIT